jgi:hypothetical protein
MPTTAPATADETAHRSDTCVLSADRQRSARAELHRALEQLRDLEESPGQARSHDQPARARARGCEPALALVPRLKLESMRRAIEDALTRRDT